MKERYSATFMDGRVHTTAEVEGSFNPISGGHASLVGGIYDGCREGQSYY